MTLFVTGLNHRGAPLAVRERLAIAPHALTSALDTLRTSYGLPEAAVLSTCNRLELYVTCPDPATASQRLLDFLTHQTDLPPAAWQPHLYRYGGAQAVQHLFRVTTGLDSMILGETEVTAQVKQAYLAAQAHGATGLVLNRLFQKALHAAKLVRSETGIAQGQASIGSIVAALARERFGKQLAQCDVLLWGAGKAGEATARHLIQAGIRQLWIVNRTQTRAKELANLCQGGWVSWEQARAHLAHVDIAIVCTQAPHYVIEASDLETVRSVRGERPLFLVDLAVPRNVEPALAQRAGVTLYNIDDLQAIALRTVTRRQRELDRCEALLKEQAAQFWDWWQRMMTQEAHACAPLAASASV